MYIGAIIAALIVWGVLSILGDQLFEFLRGLAIMLAVVAGILFFIYIVLEICMSEPVTFSHVLGFAMLTAPIFGLIADRISKHHEAKEKETRKAQMEAIVRKSNNGEYLTPEENKRYTIYCFFGDPYA